GALPVKLGEVRDLLDGQLRQAAGGFFHRQLARLHPLEKLPQRPRVHRAPIYHTTPSIESSRESDSSTGAATMRPAYRTPGSRRSVTRSSEESRSPNAASMVSASVPSPTCGMEGDRKSVV